MTQIPFAEVRNWMFEAALPFWGEQGLDREHGGFLEELTLDGRETTVDFKRTRVTCRQIYVFSHAAMMGWAPGAALAERGYAYLVDHAWLGPSEGWARLLSRTGDVIDPKPDLYDLAFVLFALAWRYRASGDPEALRFARRTLDFIETHMRAPHGGYWHALPPTGPRLQNPHMHLCEACLAAFDATQEQRFLDRASEVAALFRSSFFDGRTLGEYFTEDWVRVAGEEGHRAEPGHQLEWAWILASYQKAAGADFKREAEALVAFAERSGVDPASQAVYDEVRDDGAPLKRTSRTWPNTERIKGHLALFELSGRDPSGPVAGSARLLLDRYLAVKPKGSWIDQFDGEGRPLSKVAPTSTLYHVFLAFAEILRLEPRLSQMR